jgi:hypothetical protein
MTSPPLQPSARFPVRPRPRTWFERNWKWLVPVLVVLVIVAFSVCVGVVVHMVESTIQASYPYRVAVKRAKESPAVTAKLGTPVHIGSVVSGTYIFKGSAGNAKLSIPISGPNGKGRIIVVAEKHANRWNFETLEVDVKGEDQPIGLLEPELKPAPVPETSPRPTGNSM